MDIIEKKRLIVNKIETVQEEWVLRAIEKLLDIDDNDDSPDWHMNIVNESLVEYQKNPTDVVKWEDIKKEWKDGL